MGCRCLELVFWLVGCRAMVVVGSVGDNMVVGGLGAFEGYIDGG